MKVISDAPLTGEPLRRRDLPSHNRRLPEVLAQQLPPLLLHRRVYADGPVEKNRLISSATFGRPDL